MNYFTISIMLMIVAFQCGCAAFADELIEELPVYSPRILVVGSDGEAMTQRRVPTLEYKKVYLKINTDENSKTGYLIPSDIENAKNMFRKSISPDLYAKLMCGYKEIATNGYSEKYPELTERFGDFAIFFSEAWDLKINKYLIKDYEKRKDYAERFEGLLDSLFEGNRGQCRGRIQPRSA